MAVLLRLCDKDRESFPGPEWVRFDEDELDDCSFVQLNEFETGMNISLEFLLQVDKPAQTTRWTAARVWLARKMAGIDTPALVDFDIKVRKVKVRQDTPEPAADAGDADPPDSSRSSPAARSKKASR